MDPFQPQATQPEGQQAQISMGTPPMPPIMPTPAPAEVPVVSPVPAVESAVSLENFIRQQSVAPKQEPVAQPQFTAPVAPVEPVKATPTPPLFGDGLGKTVEAPVSPLGSSSTKETIVEKIVYKKQRVHGFFRTLTILALVVVGFLMLLEALDVFSLNIDGFNLNLIYPIFVIFSSIVIWSYRGIFGKIFGLLLFLAVFAGSFIIGVYSSLNPSTKTKFGSYVSYPLSSGTMYSKVFVETLISNLSVQGKQTSNLLEGNYASDKNLLITSGVSYKHDYLIVSEDTKWNLLGNWYSTATLGVNAKQPVNLYIKSLLTMDTVNLSQIAWKKVQLYAGAGLLDVTLGKTMEKGATMDIEAGAADVTLRIRKSVGVKLHYSHKVGKADLINFTSKEAGYYESSNLAQSSQIADVTIHLGAGRLKIVWID